MKFFQQLMLAPVAVGLIVPSATAAELNLDGVNQYSTTRTSYKYHSIL
jgi:phospholipid N-methyltransferase